VIHWPPLVSRPVIDVMDPESLNSHLRMRLRYNFVRYTPAVYVAYRYYYAGIAGKSTEYEYENEYECSTDGSH
jgi:hypothetical protein